VKTLYGIFIVGTAGSGKSLLSASLAEWLRTQGEDVGIVNLDPGVLSLPYNPDVDIRNSISVKQLMEKFQLGPNGALVMAVDLVADQSFKLNQELADLNPTYVIVDTPGQMELFAFRASGPFIAKELTLDQKMVLYLFDAPFCANPFNYVSNMFLSASVYLRLMLPQVHVLSKVDLISPKDAKKIIEWSSTPSALDETFRGEPSGSIYLLAKDIFNIISRLRLDFSLMACSAKTLQNFESLHASMERIFTRGEKE